MLPDVTTQLAAHRRLAVRLPARIVVDTDTMPRSLARHTGDGWARRRAVFDALRAAGAPLTTRQLLEQARITTIDPAQAASWLGKMAERGQIVRAATEGRLVLWGLPDWGV